MYTRANIPITIYEEGTFDQTFIWKIGSDVETAIPVDLTGWTAKMQVRAKIKDVEALISITHLVGSPEEHDYASAIYIPYQDEYDIDCGMYRIYIRDEDTIGLCEKHKDIDGAYDLILSNPVGEARMQQYGAATLVAAVTRTEDNG